MTKDQEKEQKDLATTEEKALQEIPRGKSLFFNVEKFKHARDIAEVYSKSSMVPKHFQGSVGNCMIALNLAERLGVDEFMLMQKMYIVHGRPGIEAQLAIALVNGSGKFRDDIAFRYEGKGKTNKGVERPDKCTAYAVNKKTGMTVESTVTWEMVNAEGWNQDKKNQQTGYVQASKWNTLPYQMFAYRAAMFLARTYCPDVLLGFQTVEEIEDVIDLEKSPNGFYSSDAAEKTKVRLEGLKKRLDPEPETGEAETQQEEQPMTEPEPAAETQEPGSSLWEDGKNKQGGGYSTFIFKNLEAIKKESADVIEKFRDKWDRLYPGKDPFPIPPQEPKQAEADGVENSDLMPLTEFVPSVRAAREKFGDEKINPILDYVANDTDEYNTPAELRAEVMVRIGELEGK